MIYKSFLIEKDINLIKNNIALFYGENLGLKNNFKDKIKKKFSKSEILNFSQDDIMNNEELLFKEILNISLFNEQKVFFVNQANDKILELIKKIELKINSQKLFLFSEVLDKKSKLRNYFEKSKDLGILPCYEDNEITLKRIISEKLKEFSGVSNQALNTILDNCGLDRFKIENELSKIVSYFENKQINEIELERILDSRTNDSFDDLKNQALIGNKDKTNKLIGDTVLETEKNILYLNLVNQRLIKLLEVSKNKKKGDLEEAISKIRPPVFWKDKPIFYLQAKKWNQDKVKKMLDKTYNLELKMKSNSSIDQRVLIKKLIIDLCNLANAS